MKTCDFAGSFLSVHKEQETVPLQGYTRDTAGDNICFSLSFLFQARTITDEDSSTTHNSSPHPLHIGDENTGKAGPFGRQGYRLVSGGSGSLAVLFCG